MSIEKDCILMDVDGVLLDMVPSVQEYVLSKFNLHITANMITSWDWDYALGIPLVCNEFWDFVWNNGLKMYPKAVEFIHTLKALGFRVIAVSQRSSPAGRDNARRQFLDFEFDYWVLVNNLMDKVRYSHEIE